MNRSMHADGCRTDRETLTALVRFRTLLFSTRPEVAQLRQVTAHGVLAEAEVADDAPDVGLPRPSRRSPLAYVRDRRGGVIAGHPIRDGGRAGNHGDPGGVVVSGSGRRQVDQWRH